MHNYDDEFFDYVNLGAQRSAEILLPLLKQHLPIESVLDVGCGEGAWLDVWKKLGVSEVHGVDGDYVAQERLIIAPNEFTAADLSAPFNLNRQFDLVQSLEVGEHLPRQSSDDFVESIVKHGKCVLFSAAAIGQGGDSHINEQHYEFWRQKFAKHHYVAIDYTRPKLMNDKRIEPWYRYNTFLYVHRDLVGSLPSTLKTDIVDDSQPLRDISPLWYQARKKLISFLPISLGTKIAKCKESWTVIRKIKFQKK